MGEWRERRLVARQLDGARHRTPRYVSGQGGHRLTQPYRHASTFRLPRSRKNRSPQTRISCAIDSFSQVAATRLLALYGLEQRLEVALAEAERPVPLDQLEEHGGTVTHRLGEDLQQVAVLVPWAASSKRPVLSRNSLSVAPTSTSASP